MLQMLPNVTKCYRMLVQYPLTPLPVCLSDGGPARPCDPSDLIRCRKYVKSQKARGGYRHTSTHKDTSTQ